MSQMSSKAVLPLKGERTYLPAISLALSSVSLLVSWSDWKLIFPEE